jgi:large subunit ribosomal protein L25
MAKQVQLKAKARTETGKGQVKRMRGDGVVPGVVYGAGVKPMPITVASKALAEVLAQASSGNVLVDLQVDEGGQTRNRLALLQEVQSHPVNDVLLHVDFREVSATAKMRTTVAVRPVGEPVGVKTGGGVLEFVLRELHVECLPKDLPDVVEVNVEKLEIGQTISVGDLAVPASVTVLDPKDRAVFTVAAPMAEEVEAAPAEGAPTEPEVIGEKKAEGEEGEAAPAEKGKAEAKPAAAGKAEAGKPAAGKADAKPAAGAAPAAKPEAKKK